MPEPEKAAMGNGGEAGGPAEEQGRAIIRTAKRALEDEQTRTGGQGVVRSLERFLQKRRKTATAAAAAEESSSSSSSPAVSF